MSRIKGIKHLVTFIPTILLFIWISFFPQPIQAQYHLVPRIFLGLSFLVLIFIKRGAVFKFSDWPLWIFILSLSVNVFFAQDRNVALRTYLDLSLPLLFIYYLVAEGVSSGRALGLLARAICLSSILVASLGLFEILFKFDPLYQHFIENPFYKRYIFGFVRPVSTQFHAPILGTYLIACLPFSFLLLRQDRSFWAKLGGVSLVLNASVAILTFSRGVFLGLTAMVIFYLIVEKKYRRLSVFLLILLGFVVACSFFPYPVGRYGINFMTAGEGGPVSAYRLERMAMAGKIIKDHPFAGIGFQHFHIRFYDYYPGNGPVFEEFMIADNMYLTILSETGLLGSAGFLIFIFSIFRKARKRMRTLDRGSPGHQQLVLILTGFVALLVNMAGYELFYWASPYVCFCLLAGLIEAGDRRLKTENSS